MDCPCLSLQTKLPPSLKIPKLPTTKKYQQLPLQFLPAYTFISLQPKIGNFQTGFFESGNSRLQLKRDVI